jgi:ParB family transcriptional regulator, chromosome partitioning protein
MKSAEDLKAKIGGNMRESMASHRPATVSFHGETANPRPTVTTSTAPPFHGETAKYRGASRLRDALAVELDRIIPDPDQPRKEFDSQALEDLAASLKARGQLQPIRARYDAQADRWVIVAGERRYRAAIVAGLPSVMLIEAKGSADPDEILEDQLVENCLREDLKPIEQARAFRTLIDRRGWSYRQLSDHLHVAPASVARALALLELPDDVQGRVEAGELAPSVAYEVSRIDDQATQREVAARVVAEGLNRAEAVQEVRRAESRSTVKRAGAKKGRGGAKPKLPTERTIKTSVGLKVTVEGRKGIEPAAMVAALREVTAKVENELAEDQAAA